MYAMPRDTPLEEKSCWGVSNDPVVSRLTWPEKDVSVNKLVARRAEEPIARPSRSTGANGPGTGPPSASSSPGRMTSLRMPRRA